MFVVENDYWVDGGKKRNTLDLLRENMQLEILVDRAVPGEQWPWFVVRGGFARVPNSKLQGTAAERRQRRKERLEQRSAGLAGDVWAHSHSNGGKAVDQGSRRGQPVHARKAPRTARDGVPNLYFFDTKLPQLPKWQGKASQLTGLSTSMYGATTCALMRAVNPLRLHRRRDFRLVSSGAA